MGSFGNERYLDRFGLVYARVSSRKQKLEGQGLVSQETRCKRELEKLEIPYKRSFLDSFSGGGDFMRRPAMKDLLEFIDANPHRKFVVIFDDLKRFARDTEFHLKLRASFKMRDTELLCLNYNFDDSPEGVFAETVLAAQNELERKQNQRQVIQKQQARMRNGFYAFSHPLGYTKYKDILHGTMFKPTKKAQILKDALEGYANKRFLNKMDVAKFLQENKVISSKQKPDRALGTIDNILRNAFYAGYIHYPKWDIEMIKGHHIHIIEPETYYANLKRLERKPSSRVRKDVRDDFELRGLVNCASCSKPLTGAPSRSKTGKLHNYYKCPNKSCKLYGKSIKAEDIHNSFQQVLKGVKATRGLTDLALKIFDDAWTDEMKYKETQNRNSQNLREEIESQIRKMTIRASSTEDETIQREYEKQIKALANELEILTSENDSKRDYKIPYRTSREKVIKVLETPYSVWKNYDVYRKQRFFNFIFESNLEYDKFEGYRTPNYSLPIRIFEAIESKDPNLVEELGTKLNLILSNIQDFLIISKDIEIKNDLL